jgi:hypothetical protein
MQFLSSFSDRKIGRRGDKNDPCGLKGPFCEFQDLSIDTERRIFGDPRVY